MTSGHEQKPNPYQAPMEVSVPAKPSREELTDRDLLIQFREQMLALGAAWALTGLVSLVVAYSVLTRFFPSNVPEVAIAVLVMLVSAFAICIGILICCKRMAAVRASLVLSYVLVVMSALSLNVCLGFLLLVVILQSHRVTRWALQLEQKGIPMTANPSKLHVKP